MKFLYYAFGIIAFFVLTHSGANGEPSLLAEGVTALFQLDALGDKISNVTDYIK